MDNIRRLMGRQPIFGICLGHQLTGIALGGKTFKLKFGHHGGNHPVKQLKSGKIEITAHNHNFAVDPDSLPQSEVELTHIDLNDQTLEGLRHRNMPLFCVQYHPEACAGPARFALSVQGFCEDDGGVEGVRVIRLARREYDSSVEATLSNREECWRQCRRRLVGALCARLFTRQGRLPYGALQILENCGRSSPIHQPIQKVISSLP